MKILSLMKYGLIAVIPIHRLRIFAYRRVCGYDIDQTSQIGFLTFLVAQTVTMRSAQIGSLNIIRLNNLVMAPGSLIGKLNHVSRVRCINLAKGALILSRNFIGGTYLTSVNSGRENLTIGERSQLSIGCFIDLSDSIDIGCDVVVAGAGTQMWTHGFNHLRQRSSGPIKISDNVFIGTASIIVQNIQICSNVVVAAGSVVHRSITESGSYASSQLHKIR